MGVGKAGVDQTGVGQVVRNRELRTVDFWLIVCGDTRSCAYLLQSKLFPWFFLYTFTTFPASYSVGFVALGRILYEQFYVDIFYKPRPPGYPAPLQK